MSLQFAEVEVGMSKDMPSKVVIYGVPKIGKSRLAAQWPDAFFVNIEGGLNYLGRKVRATPKLESFDEVLGWLKHIRESAEFTAGAIVIDSMDWAETLAQAKIVKQEGAKSIVDPACKAFSYYKGVEMAASDTYQIIRWLDIIYKEKGIPAILIAHSHIRTVDLPDKDAFSRYELKMSKQLGSKVNEWADLILFADYSFEVTKDGKPTEPKPMLQAGGSASYVGGGRMLLKKSLPLDYELLKKEICS